ncbi:unnamed protein product [Ectocarpus sp. 13 AM-2016]
MFCTAPSTALNAATRLLSLPLQHDITFCSLPSGAGGMWHEDEVVLPQISAQNTSGEGNAVPPLQEQGRRQGTNYEVEVAKAIILREEYLLRVKANLDDHRSKFGKDQEAFEDLLSLVDLLRIATVDTVEAVAHWRRVQGNPAAPFIWKSVNYLLKIGSDLDFLDSHAPLRMWLRVSLRRNPFLVPIPTEKLALGGILASQPGHHAFSEDKQVFFSVGGSYPRATTRDMHEWNPAPSNLRVGGSAIADGDMVRIRGAAAVIAQEEALHGRYTVDSSARLVPVGTAEKCKFSRQLVLDDKKGMHLPASVSAPFIALAGVGQVPEENSSYNFGGLTSDISDRLAKPSLIPPASGKASAKRAGGKLRPVTVHSALPRKRPPLIRRSVGALLRAEMMYRKQQNKQLQQELEDLRHHLSEKSRTQSRSPEVSQDQNPCHGLVGYTSAERGYTCRVLGQSSPAEFGEAALKIQQKCDEVERKTRRQEALEEQYVMFQAKERTSQNKKRAQVLERKRRLLEQDPDLLEPSEDDEYTLEDGAATQVQRITRGVQGRTRVKKLRPVLKNAATKIQGIIRGRLGRSRVGLKIVDKRAVTNIQRVWRGHLGRLASISDRRELERTMAARSIQKIARGRSGRRRVGHKRGLRQSASRGSEVVGVKQLFHQDIIELADAVESLLVKDSATAIPGIVLGLLKVVALMLEEDDESGATTRYNALGVKLVNNFRPAVQFSWRDALVLLRRSCKLLRRLRQIAEGPSNRRPRMVYFSQAAVQVYAALRCDQGWNVSKIGLVGRGAKACQHLMLWVDALQEVFAYQREFPDEVGSDRMPWVARTQQSVRGMRHLELSRMVWEHAITCVQQVLLESGEMAPKPKANFSRMRGNLRVRVVERALKTLQSHEECARDALSKTRQEEEDAQRNDKAREQLREDMLVDDLNRAEKSLVESLIRLEEAKTAARDGIETDQVHLQLCLDELTTCEVVRRERWASVEMFRTQRRRNSKRTGVDVEVWGDLRHQVRVVGELEAACTLASEDLNEHDPDRGATSAGSRNHDLELLQARTKEAQSAVATARTRLGCMEEEQENANALANEAELQKEETVLPHEWDDPSEEEREEDLREDEQCARYEAQAATQFVPSAMIVRPFQRPRPIVICLSRDLPGSAKTKLVKQLESDLPGLTIHMDEERNMGLHVGDLQRALSIRCSVVCNVDIGIGQRCRRAFLHRLAIAKDALIPTPKFVLVVGDSKNRAGGSLDGSVGCSDRDLSVMGDGEMKRRLEIVARIIIKELQDSTFMEGMAKMGQAVTPPSQSHILVMEAMIILLSPETVFHNHIPLSSLRGVTWTEARHILGNPDKLCAAVARVDSFRIPPANLSTLQAYIGHDGWPRQACAPGSDGGVLDVLAAWSCSTIEFAVLLTNAGGRPKALCHYSTAPIGLLAAVVPMYDANIFTQRDRSVHFKVGWRAAYYQTVTAVLEDVRVFRVARRIRGSSPEGVHVIVIYQECGRLFFHTYDPESCVSNFCAIEESKVSHLLAPALDQPPEFGPSTVPCDRQDMLTRLATLLSFEAAPLNDTVCRGVSHLVCQRRLRCLLRDTRLISGYRAQVTVYEEAKGELRYCLYLADHAARIQLKVDARLLEKVLQDSSDVTGERQAITSEDTGRLLVPVTDRLVISPSRAAVVTMGAGCGGKKMTSSSQGFVLKIRCKENRIVRRWALRFCNGVSQAASSAVRSTAWVCVSSHAAHRQEPDTKLHPQDEPQMDPIRSVSGGAAPICLAQDGERNIFHGAISIRKNDWEEHQPACDTVVTVFLSSALDNESRLRATVYYSKFGAYAEVSIKGFEDLRQVVGALNQSLAHEWRRQPQSDGTAEALFNFIFHERAMIVVGKWNGDCDGYVENGRDFTVVLKRSRLYSSFKQTPVHLSGEKDTQANANRLIDGADRRGKKVFRCAVNISSTLFQITGYELPLEKSSDATPCLRFIAYDPKTQLQLVAVAQPDAVLELGGGEHSPWMARDKREALAGIIARALRLKVAHDGSPTLVVPWSGENLALADEVRPGETTRPRRDKVLKFAKRKGLSKLEVFSTRVTDFEVIITVFGKTDAISSVSAMAADDDDADDDERPPLIFNLYCPDLTESVDIDLPCAMQKMMTGRSIFQIPKGEARSSAIRRTARFLCVSLPPSSKGLQAEFLFKAQKPWLVAYSELDTSDCPRSQRPRGQPLIFVPADTDGDLITSKGISLGGLKVLISVYTKERGRPGKEGLVFDIYNQETSATATLHVSSQHLLHQVDDKVHLLEDGRLLGTIFLLTKRLLLKKSAAGGWDLFLDRKLEPCLFMGM